MFINVKNVSKIYQMGEVTFKALEDVSFELEQGNIGVILGPSGSGKSTLLNTIGGIDHVEEGSIFIDGEEITKYKDTQLTEYRRDSVGFIFQFYHLIPNLTVYENVEVSAQLSKDNMEIDEILAAVGLADKRDHYPRELSGGEQQRVSVARALVKKPKLLLCDEPTGALDYETSKEILKLLTDINEQFNTTLLIITHNQAISGLAHRVLRLRSGKIIESQLNDNRLPAERIEW